MTRIPIVAHHAAGPTSRQVSRAETLATTLASEHPDLTIKDAFRSLVPEQVCDAPALHLDDLSTIVRLDRFYDVTFLEDRSRFRATDGDMVASCARPNSAFEAYCDGRLGLGSVRWLRPKPRASTLRVAAACWTDGKVRRTLLKACRTGRLRYVHPHMGNFPVWATAYLLQQASQCPLSVIAPHPGLTRLVNNKLWFAGVVSQLFGRRAIPRTAAAHSLTAVAHLVRQLAETSRSIAIKLPGSAGGAGNMVIESRRLRDRPLGELRKALEVSCTDLGWPGEGPMLVGSWETDVLCAPSAQLWIPPESQGLPIVEGVFEQLLEGPEGYFMGSRAAELPRGLLQEIVDLSWLMGRAFQRLGYVGRCSFDLLLVGERIDDCQVQFVECNGRWGGTSLPMSLMNRLFGDWATRPYATNLCIIPGLQAVSFTRLLEYFAGDLFDAQTRRGSLIFLNPGGMVMRSGIDVLAIADSWEAATRQVRVEIPRRLRELTRCLGIESSHGRQIR